MKREDVEVAIHDNLSSHEAYISALYRHKPALTEALDAMWSRNTWSAWRFLSVSSARTSKSWMRCASRNVDLGTLFEN